MTALDAVERALAKVDEWEPAVHAWAFLDRDRARAEARTATATGPLSGVVLGVKDIFDTGDQPTEYGSAIYAGHRPRADAGVVAQLRAAGAVALGKTVTTEFAVVHPGPTTNPHRVTHTPGGSSSGSVVAVATGMVDVALGTQTAGSVIRPASFCGIFGFKPTFGSVNTAGMKFVAPSLDTIGWFARDVGLLDRVRVALTGHAPGAAPRRATADRARAHRPVARSRPRRARRGRDRGAARVRRGRDRRRRRATGRLRRPHDRSPDRHGVRSGALARLGVEHAPRSRVDDPRGDPRGR